ncbi:CDGSH iron-sulfur domain-containing protein 3, mitochondrial [Frankliniella occidentalis]|uniref:CDGSH iron-sulfur domain-containing protein 3, mitochondrial n=1 Tax=Frankliniella occidentalis TaxID=133901 RepID=A0A6J1S6I9_FRAOC|nr:CDGSH iron-sulfur domain-containing protein 3, mitochondrial [Frankliniella occidentalis]
MNVNIVNSLKNSLWCVSRNKLVDLPRTQPIQLFLRKSSDSPKVPKNVIGHIYSASSQVENGKVYDRKPFKIRLYPKKDYMWCLCGYSKSQPICDGSHKWPQYKCELKPIKFRVEEEKDYYLCNCKQTKLRPFCDGTHKGL